MAEWQWEWNMCREFLPKTFALAIAIRGQVGSGHLLEDPFPQSMMQRELLLTPLVIPLPPEGSLVVEIAYTMGSFHFCVQLMMLTAVDNRFM